MIRGSSKHVLHRLIMHTLVGGCIETDVPCAVLCQLSVECRRDGEVEIIVVLSLDKVHSIQSLSIGLSVGIIELVPVYLSVLLAGSPVVIGGVPVFQRLNGVVGVRWVPHIIVT